MNQKSHTETLNIGDRPPDFVLSEASSERRVALQDLLARGPLIVEFLRGTW